MPCRASLRFVYAALRVLALGAALSLWSSWPAALHLADGRLPYDQSRSSALRAGGLRSAWQLWQIEQACDAGRPPLEAQGVAAGGALRGELRSDRPRARPLTCAYGPATAVRVAELAVPPRLAAAFLLARAAGARALAAFGAGYAYAFSGLGARALQGPGG
jgi:hypothetical protein